MTFVSLDRPLSPLELTALGIILKRGPCVAHQVVKEFQGSQTFAYRSGAGSVYPLLRRLHQGGLLTCEGRRYELSREGNEALLQWLRPPFDEVSLSTNLDLVRSRAYFLRLLSSEEIAEWLAAARTGLRGILSDCQRTCLSYREAGDRFSELAMLGAVRETEARLGWLDEVEHALLPATSPTSD